MGFLDTRKRRLSLAPVDPDLESITSSMRTPTLRRSIIENSKYALVYLCLLLALFGVLATVGVAIWLAVKGFREKAAKRKALEELKDAVEDVVEGVAKNVVEVVKRKFIA